jgi:hypothetical protein
MKTTLLLNVLAVLALIATLVVCYYFYVHLEREEISTVLVWGSAPILIFIGAISIVRLVKSARRRK